eukprot:scaffold3709_cov68-Phaeocystis_antarctica.AAC.11
MVHRWLAHRCRDVTALFFRLGQRHRSSVRRPRAAHAEDFDLLALVHIDRRKSPSSVKPSRVLSRVVLATRVSSAFGRSR